MAVSCEILTSRFSSEETALTSFQLECSQLLKNIFSEATSPFAICSLAGAGWIGQFSKLSCLNFVSRFSTNRSIQQLSSFIFSAGIEGTFFHGCSTLRQGPFSILEFGKGSIHSSFILGSCKLAGGLAPQSFILTQLFQCFAMVQINEVCGGILVEPERGSFTEKMIRAGETSIPLLISGQILISCSPAHRIRQAKYALEIELRQTPSDYREKYLPSSLIGPHRVTAEGFEFPNLDPFSETPSQTPFWQSKGGYQFLMGKKGKSSGASSDPEKKTKEDFASSQPVVYVRESLPEDAEALLEAAKSNRFKTLNFPQDPALIKRKIAKSMASFRGEIPNLADQEFMFSILSGTESDAIPIGSSTFYPKHGTSRKPHSAYRVSEKTLTFVQNKDGPAEVGAMILHKLFQGKDSIGRQVKIILEGIPFTISAQSKYGQVGSYVRFFWAGMSDSRDYFRGRTCLAEFLPPFTKDAQGNRTNPFYEAVGRRYLGKTYDEMDLATLHNPKLLLKLPKKISIENLPEEAREIIGKVGSGTLPAVRLLEKLGFEYSHQIDPLDAGPHYVGAFKENPLFTGIKYLYFDPAVDLSATTASQYGFVGYFNRTRTPCFKACAAPLWISGEKFQTVPEVAKKLRLDSYTAVGVVLFPPEKSGKKDHKPQEALRLISNIRLTWGEDRRRYTDQLIALEMPLIFDIALHYRYKHRKLRASFYDLIQEGIEGLFTALESFDRRINENFVTWAYPKIDERIRNFVYYNSSIRTRKRGRVPERYQKVLETERKLINLGIIPSLENVAEKLKKTPESIGDLKLAFAYELSIHELRQRRPPDPYRIPPDPSPSPEETLINREEAIQEEAIRDQEDSPYLKKVEQTVLGQMVFEKIMNPHHRHPTFKEIARSAGINEWTLRKYWRRFEAEVAESQEDESKEDT